MTDPRISSEGRPKPNTNHVTQSSDTLKKNMALLACSIAFCLLLLFLTDMAFGRLHERQVARNMPRALHISGYVPDEMLGYRLAPNQHIEDNKIVGDTVVFSARYSIDERGRRVVPANEEKTSCDNFLVFFGCSVAFGIGVNDRDTLPNQLGTRCSKCCVYHYGTPGYGTQHMLALLQSGRVRDGVSERRGTAVYVMIPSHVIRVAGTMRVATQWGRDFPSYRFDSQCGVVHEGSFAMAHPHRMFFMDCLRKSGIVRYFDIDFPPVRQSHLHLTAEIILASKRLFEEQFESQGFYVLLYPTFLELGIDLQPLIQTIQKHDVSVLDYRAIPMDRNKHILHPIHDEHPSAALHAIVAEKLARDIVLE